MPRFAFKKKEKYLLAGFAFFLLLISAHLAVAFYQDNTVSEALAGGSLVSSIIGNPSDTNPVFSFANTVDADIARLVYSGLTKYDPETESIVPDLATYVRDTTRTVYTFTIHPNAKWQDGQPVTADDVMFTYQNILQKKEIGMPGLMAAHKNNVIKKIDERTVSITLKEPYIFFPSTLTFPILPKHIWEKLSPADIVKTSITKIHVGSGPYQFQNAKANPDGSSVLFNFAKNKDYYGSAPYIDNIALTAYKDDQSLKDSGVKPTTLNNVPLDIVHHIDSDEYTSLSYTLPQYVGLFLNTSSAILDDKRVRQALLLATDKDQLVKKLVNVKRIDTPFLEAKDSVWLYKYDLSRAQGSLYDAGWNLPSAPTPSPTTAPSPSPASDQQNGNQNASDERLAVSDQQNTNGNSDQQNTNTIPAPIFNSTQTSYPSTAPLNANRSTLIASPSPSPTASPIPVAQPNSTIRKSTHGDPLKLELVTSTVPSEFSETALWLKSEYAKIGVDVKVTILTPDKLRERIRTKSYDILLYGQSLGYNLDTYSYWHSTQEGTNGLNLSNLTSKTVDSLLEQIRNPFTRPGNPEDDAKVLPLRDQALKKLVSFFDDQIPAIFLYQPLYYFHYDKNQIHQVDIKNLRTFADRFAILQKSYITENRVWPQPASIGLFFNWILGGGKEIKT